MERGWDGRAGTGATVRMGLVGPLLLALCAACGLGPLPDGCDAGSEPGGRPVVAVSVPPQAYLVERLAGDMVEIVVMVPPGASPHTHEPTMAQVRAVSSAAVYVKVGHPGFPFEQTWLDRLLGDAGDVRVVDCSEGVDVHAEDPHVWASPKRVREMVPRIAAALVEVLPAQRERIGGAERRLLAEVGSLDAEVAQELADLPHRRFYVFHPAWGYLARDYGLEQVAIESEGKEPDPRALAAVLAQARKDGVGTLFVQPQFSRRSAEIVAEEIGAQVVMLDPLAREWPASVRHAAAAIRKELGR